VVSIRFAESCREGGFDGSAHARELEGDLAILQEEKNLSVEEYRLMSEHGAPVRKHAGQFP
jgi:hypothetical protein